MKTTTLVNCAMLALALSSVITSYQVSARMSDVNSFAQQLATSDRPEADKTRDAGRQPAKVMDFFGIKPGMTVLEVLSSGGYYTEVISQKVGDTGKVYAQNNRFILDVFDGRFGKEFDARFENNRLSNVKHYVKEFGEFDLENQIDVITIVLNYHDLYSNAPKEHRMKVLSQMKKALKKDGVIGLIDMESSNGNQKELHRISQELVIEDFKAAGFVLEAQGDFLRNPKDDYSKMVFDPSVRGKTDRFVFRFKKA
ncbi:class I SAM-dependent methyltransferase [Thalassotalea fusca]